MSIVEGPPGTHPLRGSRAGDTSANGTSLRPFEMLLPSDGPPVPAAASASLRAPALHASPDPMFDRRVEMIRGHLAPIQTRRSLASSFEREANPEDAVRAAYAIRWLELAPTGRRRVIRDTLLRRTRARGWSTART
jgi:hypothetical protein